MSIINKIEKEIEETIKASKPIHITLKKSEYDYRCSKILEEGDYLLTYSKKEAIKVSVVVDENTSIVNGFDEEEEEVQVILIKDSTTLLNSVKERLKITELPVTPSFLVGPPGTGKSTVIVRTIEEALKNNQRVLVLSPTNMAVGATC